MHRNPSFVITTDDMEVYEIDVYHPRKKAWSWLISRKVEHGMWETGVVSANRRFRSDVAAFGDGMTALYRYLKDRDGDEGRTG